MQVQHIGVNEVKTTTGQNIAAASLEPNLESAYRLFQDLQYANDRGTTQAQHDLVKEKYDELSEITRRANEETVFEDVCSIEGLPFPPM